MKKVFITLGLLFVVIAIPLYLAAQDAKPKVIALGDVEASYDVGGQHSYDVKETIQLGIKKQLEKIGKDRYEVNIVSPAVVTAGSEPEPADLPEMPTNRAPTQKEIAKYMAAMQQMQKQMTGQVKTHKPVKADAYFDFKVVSGISGGDTTSAASTVGEFTGLNTAAGDVGVKTTKIYLIATMRDPKTGALLDKYTAKASSVKFRNIAGYTDYDYGSDEMARERLFSSAVKDCSKWISNKVQ